MSSILYSAYCFGHTYGRAIPGAREKADLFSPGSLDKTNAREMAILPLTWLVWNVET